MRVKKTWGGWDRPRLASYQLGGLLRQVMPRVSVYRRVRLAEVIRDTTVSGTLIGFCGGDAALSWRWSGGQLEVEVEGQPVKEDLRP